MIFNVVMVEEMIEGERKMKEENILFFKKNH